MKRPILSRIPTVAISSAALFCAVVAIRAEVTPPTGFTALFNGKDLSGWRGGDPDSGEYRKFIALPEDRKAELIQKWTDTMKSHWRPENDELVNDGYGAFATT